MIAEFVDLQRYPIDRPESPGYVALIARQRQLLATDGMITLAGFINPAGIAHYRAEIDSRMDSAFHAVSTRHPYGYHRSDEFPDDHPRNTFAATESYRLARHMLSDTALDALYCWSPMRRFVADMTGNDSTYLSADPSNGLVVQVYREGCGQAWHFDQALFSTIINLGASEHGGVFECVPGLRTEQQPCYDEVKRVLAGQSPRVQQHKVAAGSFIVMLGRYTLHRVTAVQQQQPRISAVLSYELTPDVQMDWDTRRLSFGPTTPR